jgi:hypothetical protein
VSPTASDVTITYRDSGGVAVKTQTLTGVAPNAYRGLYSGDATTEECLPAGGRPRRSRLRTRGRVAGLP